MRPTGGPHVFPRRGTRGLESLADLVVQLLAVGHDHKGATAQHPAQHLLRKKHHRQTLARTLRVPEHAQTFGIHLATIELGGPQLHQPGNRLVHPQKLVVLGRLLDQPALALFKNREVLHIVQQPRRLQQATQGPLQRHLAVLVFGANDLGFVIHPFPVKKVFPGAGQRAHPRVRAVGQKDERIGVKQLRHRLALVVPQVGVIRAFERHARFLQLNEHQRQAVHKRHQVAAAAVHIARHPHLRGQQEVVIAGRGPVDHPQRLDAVRAGVVQHLDLDAVFQQTV